MIWCTEPDTEVHISSQLFNFHTQISSLQYSLVFLEAMGPRAVLAVGGVSQCPSKAIGYVVLVMSNLN